MIVDRWTVERFRGIEGPRTIQLDPHRINILSGPNGCGKSTLLHALISAFLHQHNSASAEVRKLRPWGTELGPTAEVNFRLKDRPHTIRKKWLLAKLAEFREGPKLIAEAMQAEEKLKQIVDLDAIPTLWSRQGQLADTPVGASFQKAVEASLQIQSTDPLTDKLRKLAEKHYLDFYTPTGRLKAGLELNRLQEFLTSAQSELSRVEDAQASILTSKNNIAQWTLLRVQTQDDIDKLEQRHELYSLNLSIQLHEKIADADLRLPARQQAVTDIEQRLAALPPHVEVTPNAPTREQLARLRQDHNQLTQKQTELQVSQIRLSLPPGAVFEVLEGEASGNDIFGSPRVRVRLAGLGDIEASGPVEDLAPVRATIAKLEAVLAAAGDLTALEARIAQAELAQATLDKRRALERERTLETQAIDNLQRGKTSAQGSLAASTFTLSELYEKRADYERRLDDKPLPANLPQLLEQAKKRRSELDRQTHDAQIAIAAKGTDAAKNPDELREEIETTANRLREEEIRVGAAKLLWQSILAEEATRSTGYIDQVQRRANELYSLIVAQPDDRIRLTKTLTPSAYGDADLGQLSGGEFEQIHLVTRLALAEALAVEDRQLVVLDDSLTATDQVRMDRLLDYLGGQLDRLQILFLTCHPERFTKLRDTANWIEL